MTKYKHMAIKSGTVNWKRKSIKINRLFKTGESTNPMKDGRESKTLARLNINTQRPFSEGGSYFS